MTAFDYEKMKAETIEAPVWLHFGAGNIFRCFVAALQDRLLKEGYADKGIIAAETYDYEIIEKIFRPFDNKALFVCLKSDGSMSFENIESVAESLCAEEGRTQDMEELRRVFRAPSLQMISFTITEKGYTKGTPAMKLVADMLLERFKSCAKPVAVVSFDNCARNGEKLRAGVLDAAQALAGEGKADKEFISWISDENQVSFPWTMIDKITPRPDPSVYEELVKRGYRNMEPIETSKHTFIAPFVNAEEVQYLVIEDDFPNGRPELEHAGVYFTDRATVNKVERMKVMTCLNPLHTALAVYGCVLGYTKIFEEMKDPELCGLVRKIGYTEGLPVVVDPGIIRPGEFIDEVVEKRFPNPFVPDTPQRIAVDTSQKVEIRFGETLRAYEARADLDVTSLVFIPLAIAGWLRYLQGTYDDGKPMECSPDPRLDELKQKVAEGRYTEILSDETIFGSDLVKLGLADRIKEMVGELSAGKGAVRKTLQKYISE